MTWVRMNDSSSESIAMEARGESTSIAARDSPGGQAMGDRNQKEQDVHRSEALARYRVRPR